MRVHQRQQFQQLRVVVQHLLEVRHQPEGVGRIPRIAAAEVIVDAALRHAVEHQVQRLLTLGRAGAERVLPQEPENRRIGEFHRTLQAAVFGIGLPQQGGGHRIQMHRCGQLAGVGGGHAGERLAQRGGIARHHIVVGAVCLRHTLKHLAERRPTPARLGRKIRAAPERGAVGGDEHGQRPAALLAQCVQRRHVEMVDVRPLLAVHLDVDEPLVHQRGGLRVLERLVGHDVAPVAGGVADRQQDRFFLRSRLLQRRRAPRTPVHRIVRVLQQIRRGLVTEQVRGLGHGVALLRCRADIGRHGRRHHLCGRLGGRAGGDRGDAAERAGQPYGVGRAVRPRSAAAPRLVPPAARRAGRRTRPGHGGVAARTRKLHRRGCRGALSARRPGGADGRRRCAGGARREAGRAG